MISMLRVIDFEIKNWQVTAASDDSWPGEQGAVLWPGGGGGGWGEDWGENKLESDVTTCQDEVYGASDLVGMSSVDSEQDTINWQVRTQILCHKHVLFLKKDVQNFIC